jgi:hypothetical protein
MIKVRKNVLTKLLLLTFFIMWMTRYQVFADVLSVNTRQELQTNISNAMHSRLTTYNINYTGNNNNLDIPKIINNIFSTDDYAKYTSKSYSYSYSISNENVAIKFLFAYWNTVDMDNYVNAQITKILGQIISHDMNDYQKEKAVYDWILKNVSYDTTMIKHSDYDALASPYKTVCQGYALLTYKMLNQVGIQTKILGGYAGGEPHAWNEVFLDGAWYHLDATWDATSPNSDGRVVYNYYNLTDSQIEVNHTWTLAYPVANTLFNDTLNAKIRSDYSNAQFYKDLGNAIGSQHLPLIKVTSVNASQTSSRLLASGTTSDLPAKLSPFKTANKNIIWKNTFVKFGNRDIKLTPTINPFGEIIKRLMPIGIFQFSILKQHKC